jgi:hypothetical protein
MASSKVFAGLTKWLRRAEWQDDFEAVLYEHLAPGCSEAGVSIEGLLDLVGDHNSAVLWGCVFEDFLTRDLDDDRNVADDYLKRRGWKESASNRSYIAALRSSVMSLYEISDIVPDESFLARDLVQGGEPIRVSERSATRYLKPWDRMAARLVRVGSRIEMAGGAMPFDHDASETVVTELRRAGKKMRAEAGKFARKLGQEVDSALIADAWSDTQRLRDSAFVFTNIWLDHLLQRILNPTVLQMCNAEGDELVFTTASYPLGPGTSPDAIRHALAAIPALRPESETFWNWIGPNQPAGRTQRSDSQMFITTLDDGSLVLGTVELKDGILLLEANSRQRAERGQALIAPVLGSLVGESVVETRAIAELMASRPERKPEALPSALSPDEGRAVLRAHMDLYYKNLLDVPVPILGNVTPRRAARSAMGRQKLVAWLKLLENSSAKHGETSGTAGYDFLWMWEKLGVVELRR